MTTPTPTAETSSGAKEEQVTDDNKVTLHYPGGEADFPVLESSSGAPSIDLSSLTRQTGYTALDQGFVNTASTKSAITFIDGDQGVLRYRGYPIEDVAQHSTFLEVAWLLIYGELPSAFHQEKNMLITYKPHTCLFLVLEVKVGTYL